MIKTKKVIIQEEISITQKEIDEIIEGYRKDFKLKLAFGDFSGGSKEIINEIKKLSEIGKKILLMDYNFKKWEKKHKI